MYEHDHHQKEININMGRAFFATVIFCLVEFYFGLFANSLTLFSDALHMASDSLAIGIAALAIRFAKIPADDKHSYGHGRAEIMSSLFNNLMLLFLGGLILYNAINRMSEFVHINSKIMIVIGLMGLCVNIYCLFILSKGKESINTKSAKLHIVFDIMGSILAIISGFIIYFTGYYKIDLIFSIILVCLIFISASKNIYEAAQIIMDSVPDNINRIKIIKDMEAVEGVLEIHDLHIWRVDSHRVALTAHIVIQDLTNWMTQLEKLNSVLLSKHNIDHPVLQPEQFN